MQRSYFEALSKKEDNRFSIWIYKDEDSYPAVRSSSEIAGTASILIAAELMITNEFGKGLLFVT
jgi:alanine dehydrogenase